jgi:two-component system cell cycle sensor histidine kinase/response regulator CckA
MAKVLVVDDEEPIRLLATLVLSRAGHDVISAESGDRASGVALGFGGVEIVLLDVHTPGRPWTETLNDLRRQLPEIKCVLSSGHSKDSLESSAEDLSRVYYLQKPYRTDELTAIISRALETS